MKEILKSAFTLFPHCIATYVCIIGAVCLLVFGWQPKKIDPPVYIVSNPEMVAREAAQKANGNVWHVGYTGSMKPLLQGGEYAVTAKDFSNIKEGQILVYHATYNKNPIIHRAVQHDSYGWLMSGDSAKISESWSRVTEQNYIGTVIAIYK